ncbi:MAG: cysteine desulfurase [Candidatus Doudnabacteria bacterium]|nr:cysteine desulfurase [Candidatus Doudnabacteria bacterium]
MKRIYLDNAATTPIDKRVAKTMRDFELEFYGNPSSTHREGQQARAKIDFARADLAKFINAKPQEIIFTSGATEANNLAIQGIIHFHLRKSKLKPHVITTFLEHQSVYNLVRELESRGVIEATFVKPDSDGIIKADQILTAIKPNTILVSVIFVSNEIGSVLPVREIGNAIKENHPHVSYHIDAVQAAKFFNLNVEKLNCDLLILSAHKIFGPKGIGALYIKTGTKLENLMFGGSQEYDKRPGTQNTTGIIGFAEAIKLLGSLEQRQADSEQISKLRDKLIREIAEIGNIMLNGPEGELRTADNVSITVCDMDQDSLTTALDLAGIAASTGSACVSGSSKPSHVIEALRKPSKTPGATIRFTLSKYSTPAEITYVIKQLWEIIPKLRK